MLTKIKEKDNDLIKDDIDLEKNNKSSKKNKRDVAIDLIRIIACLSVIGTHLCLQVLNQCYNRIDWSRLLEKCFLTDGVPLFFMITGFFLVNGRSYIKIWKSTIFKILIPSFIFIVITQIFYSFFVNLDTFANCLKAFTVGTSGIIKTFLTGNVAYINDLCSHLWYIFSYVKIIIWIPVLWLVCKENKESKLARNIMMILTFLNIVLMDVQRFLPTFDISPINIITIIPKELLYVLLGYELFLRKDKIKNNKKIFIVSIIGYVIVNLLRYKIEIFYMVLNSFVDITGRESFMEWRYTSLNIFSGIFLFLALYSFEIKNEKLSKVICWISDKTFGIYLIHYVILAKVNLYEFEKIEKIYFEIIYLIVGTILTFIVSIAITTVIKNIKDKVKNIIVKEIE